MPIIKEAFIYKVDIRKKCILSSLFTVIRNSHQFHIAVVKHNVKQFLSLLTQDGRNEHAPDSVKGKLPLGLQQKTEKESSCPCQTGVPVGYVLLCMLQVVLCSHKKGSEEKKQNRELTSVILSDVAYVTNIAYLGLYSLF